VHVAKTVKHAVGDVWHLVYIPPTRAGGWKEGFLKIPC
jgi:hypothetical protein